MRQTDRNVRRVAFAALGLMAGALLAVPAQAQEAWDTKILNNMLGAVGLKSEEKEAITYRERSPLVIPPGRDLPAPESAERTDANWPVDPEAKRAKEAKAAARTSNAGDPFYEQGRPLLPDQIGPNTRTARGSGSQSTNEYDSQRPLSQSELGYKGGLFSGLFKGWSKEQESKAFTQEPPRTSLIAPPAGYQTPSNGQAYGINGPSRSAPAQAYDYSTKHGESNN